MNSSGIRITNRSVRCSSRKSDTENSSRGSVSVNHGDSLRVLASPLTVISNNVLAVTVTTVTCSTTTTSTATSSTTPRSRNMPCTLTNTLLARLAHRHHHQKLMEEETSTTDNVDMDSINTMIPLRATTAVIKVHQEEVAVVEVPVVEAESKPTTKTCNAEPLSTRTIPAHEYQPLQDITNQVVNCGREEGRYRTVYRIKPEDIMLVRILHLP